MLGRLARWLRILGYDTCTAKEASTGYIRTGQKGNRHPRRQAG
ncbi:MAG TPA: Mut7-C RNAse domain-containing protein [Anaerolineae bacterium]|nr:Mut7-C RNAse domain-containing protein [Anaerolineae bacterium]